MDPLSGHAQPDSLPSVPTTIRRVQRPTYQWRVIGKAGGAWLAWTLLWGLAVLGLDPQYSLIRLLAGWSVGGILAWVWGFAAWNAAHWARRIWPATTENLDRRWVQTCLRRRAGIPQVRRMVGYLRTSLWIFNAGFAALAGWGPDLTPASAGVLTSLLLLAGSAAGTWTILTNRLQQDYLLLQIQRRWGGLPAPPQV